MTRSIIIVLLSLLFYGSFAQEKISSMTTYDYEKAWKEVTDFQREGLPQSALKKVNEIYDEAKKSNNSGQLVKAVIHKLKFTEETEEGESTRQIEAIRKELESAGFPLKPLLHSMAGEMYWRYYEQNRWKFHSRTETVNSETDELATWSLSRIVKEAKKHYDLSLKDERQIKSTRVDVFVDVLLAGNEKGRAYRPTLFDFLANRALQFYSNEEPEIIHPGNEFTISDERLFEDAETFSRLQIETTDTLSMKYNALRVYQQLAEFHRKDREVAAHVQVEIDRLHFIRQQFVHPDKNVRYLHALERLEERIRPNPAASMVMYQQAALYTELAAQFDPLRGEAHKWDYKTAFEICQRAKSVYPESDGAKLCSNLQGSIQSKSLGATIEAVNVPQKDFRSLITYRNFTTLYYRIIKTSRKEVSEQRQKGEKVNYDQQEKNFLDFFLKKPATKEGKYTLPSDNDYHQHSIEVKLDALAEGEYLVVYSHRSDFSTADNGIAYVFTVVSNIAYIHRAASDGSTEFYLLNRQSGEPIAGVRSDFFQQRYDYKRKMNNYVKVGSLTSDENGYVKIPFQNDNRSRHFIVNFSHRNDFISTEGIDAGRGYGNGTIYQYKREKPFTERRIFFFLDRAIYRPGQTIYFKGLVVQSDGKTSTIVPGYSTTIELHDVNQELKGEIVVKANEYGTFSGTFTAPTGGLMGNMTLTSSDETGSIDFSVEEYKRPKFEVTFHPVKGTFKLNDRVIATGKAEAYSGASLDGATVQYRVVRNANFPFWWWCRWGYYPPSPDTEITHGRSETDNDGNFTIPFDAIPDPTVDPSSDPTFNYTVYADVTDVNGETHSASTIVQVAYKSLRVRADLPPINRADKSIPQREFSIQTENISGEFEAAKGSIKIYLLQSPARALRNRLWPEPDRYLYAPQEFAKLFPLDLYADENNKFKWPRAKETFSLNFNTAESRTFRLNDVGNWQDGEYVLIITSTDKEGKPVQEYSYFSVYAPASGSIPAAEVNYQRELKTSGEPGETASILVGTSAGKIKALFEIERDGSLLKKEWLSLNNEQKLLQIALKEEDRGNLGAHYTFVKDNRFYHDTYTILVPYSNKELSITFESFRDKLQPGQQEQWKLKLKGPKASRVAAEMVAALYDESLDVFRENQWSAYLFGSNTVTLNWQSINGFDGAQARFYDDKWNTYDGYSVDHPYYDHLNWFNFDFGRVYRGRVAKSARYSEELAESTVAPQALKQEEGFAMADSAAPAPVAAGNASTMQKKEDLTSVKVRTNLNETAFFLPHLMTNAEGEIVVSFTIPEALTRWKMLGFAHTKDLQSAMVVNHLVTQKELMVVPNQPRFFRENDTMIFTAKLSSMSDQPLVGQAQLLLFDALTMRPIDDLCKNTKGEKYFSLDARKSASVEWTISIPEGIQAITYRVVAKAGAFSDGEEMTLPVVTNRILVTETMPLPIRGKQQKKFTLQKMASNESKTLKHHKFTLEYTSNPAWYAVQALPYLMEYPFDCVEQSFSRFYANSIATHIANGNPRIKQVFDVWKNIQPDALLSNLEKNQELKSALLEETPWVLQARDESQRKHMLGVLFDLNRMASEQDHALDKVLNAQTSNGGFAWFKGMPEDRYMTQHIVAGIGHLDVLGVRSIREDGKITRMISNAIDFLDRTIREDYEELKDRAKKKQLKLEDNNISYIQFHYLYARSYFKDILVNKTNKEAFDYYYGQARKYWLDSNLYTEGMACLALHRFGDPSTPATMIKSFTERALTSEETGMYWKTTRGYFWYQAPIETQSLMIEVYDEVANDHDKVEAMKIWLLKQKQTQDWKTTKATVEACYALLRRGTDLLSNTKLVEIKVGDQRLDPEKTTDKVEAGTGYFKTSWSAGEIKRNMSTIEVSKSDEGVAWGAAYWQYFEQLDKITPAETPLKLKKELYVVQNTASGPVISPISAQPLHVGDLVRVRIEIRVDRAMEYVHLKDMRAAAFEPMSTLSGHKFQDGLYYYESTRDLATNFFMGYLPKGTYVFEYDLRVAQRGDFSNGLATIQCMYAPEFSSHSAGIRVKVE
jgi:uncharacterized protein YfaS (alpha-2-macroglobulin family)